MEMQQNGNNSIQINSICGGRVVFNIGQANSESDAVPYMNEEYSKIIIVLCKSINVHLVKVGKTLLKNPSMFNNNHLASNDFNGWLSKLKDFINTFHTVEISKETNLSTNNPLTLLAEYILALSPDISMDLNTFYHKRIAYTADCIYKYSEKSSDFFMAIGALGLAKDHSDEKIFECIISDLQTFFMMIRDILDTYTKKVDYSIAENKASDKMNESLYHHIRFCFNKKSKPALKILLEHEKMLDVDLAQATNTNVVSLRKILFPATKSFLRYQYHSSDSTEIWIPEPYNTAIRENYNKLFATDELLNNPIEADL